MRRPLLLPVLGLVLLAAGCGSGQPEVTATSGDNSVEVSPLQYCAVDGGGCTQNGSAAQHLRLDGTAPIQLAVDDDLAKTPWRVEYRVLDATGHLSAACSPVFGPNAQHDYQVRVPAGQRLQLVNVYQIGAVISADHAQVNFGVRGTWTVLVAPDAKLPKPGETLCPDVSR